MVKKAPADSLADARTVLRVGLVLGTKHLPVLEDDTIRLEVLFLVFEESLQKLLAALESKSV